MVYALVVGGNRPPKKNISCSLLPYYSVSKIAEMQKIYQILCNFIEFSGVYKVLNVWSGRTGILRRFSTVYLKNVAFYAHL